MSEVQTIPLVRVTCCECAALFALNLAMYQELEHTHQEFYCPRGHRQYFTRSYKKGATK